MLSIFLSAVALSIAFCAPPGAVTAEVLRRGLLYGFGPVVRFQLGAVVGSSFWAALSLAGAMAIAQAGSLQPLLGTLGSALVWRMAWQAFGDARRGRLPTPTDRLAEGDFLAGALLSLANPFAVAFWLGVGGGLAAGGAAGAEYGRAVVFLSGFILGSLLYRVTLAALIAWGRRFLTAIGFRCVNALSCIVLTYFGLRLLTGIVLE